MKQFLFTIVLVFVSFPVFCQTAIFNHYKNHHGVQASVIKNYDIGNHTKVTVTMLEAADSTTYIELRKEIKDMNSIDKKYKSPDTNKASFNIGMVSSLTMDVSIADNESNTYKCDRTNFSNSDRPPHHQIDIQSISPLPGDSGEYLVCGSNKTLTILVFHCPDHNTYLQIMKFVLINSIKNSTL